MTKDRFRIIAIDDDAADLKLLGRHLHQVLSWETDFLPFTSWAEAEAALKTGDADLIFVDYLLGQQTGLDVVKLIRAQGHSLPVIMLTGQGDEQIAAETVRAGADDYLTKQQLDADTLRRVIESSINQWRLRQEKALLTEQLQQSQKMETIGTLAGGIAHDFNNMLAAIIGCLELSLLKSENPKVSGYLNQAKTVCGQMVGVVQQLLSFSRREGPEQEDIELYQLFQDVKMILDHTLPKSTRLIVASSAEDVPLRVNTAMLQQVLLNLCLNASDAMPDGGDLNVSAQKTFLNEPSPETGGKLSGEAVLIEVRDTGHGIDDETVRRIFEPFFTTKEFGTRKGTGLGLSIVWNNVQKMGGTITVTSQLGTGTCFRIYLPLGCCHDLQPKRHERSEDLLGGNETILVVDDETVMLSVVETMLEQLGYKVYTEAGGEKALQTYRKNLDEISLVLLDISMPHMDGRECLRQLLRIDPGVKAVFASGHDTEEEMESLLALGAIDVIQKPYNFNEFSHKIRMVLDDPADSRIGVVSTLFT